MSTMATAADDGGFRLPTTVSVGLCVTLLASIMSGAWYGGTLTNSLANTNAKLADFQHDVMVHREAYEIERRTSASQVNAIDARLIRIEAQLAYIITAQATRK